MTKNFLFHLLLILFNFISIYISKIVVIPFRTNITENKINNISQKFLQKSLYTENLIGTPSQVININIIQNEFNFYLGEDTCNKIPITYYQCSNSSTYNTKSGEIIDQDYGQGFISQEFFSFYNLINLKSNITSSNMTFFFSKNYKVTEPQQVCAILGLRLKEKYVDYQTTNSFIEIIKKINIINESYWSYIYFEKDKNNKIKNINGINNEYIMENYEGMLVFGETPHDYEPNKYKKVDLVNVLASKRYKTELYWDIVFKNIYFFQKNNTVFNFNYLVQANLDISINYVLAPFSFFQNITEYFFKEFLNNNKCKFNYIIDSYLNYTFISCNKKDFNNEDIKKFPTIFFEHLDYNYTFNLTYDDLFEEFNDKIMFLIYYLKSTNEIWRLGKIFLKKYKFIFNQDSKTIGFYKKNYNEDDKGEEEYGKNAFGFLTSKNFWINLIWITACVICLGIGAYFGYNYIKKERKKKANELQDDYDYSIQDDIN